jgi:hypothetical protein
MRLALLALSLTLLAGCGHFKKDAEAEAAPAAEVSRPVAAAGEMCSGIAGIQCAEGLSCIFEDGACTRRPMRPAPVRQPQPSAPANICRSAAATA